MDQAVKERWVAALRSGNYQQTQGSLRNNSQEFCCLGVLCDVEQPGVWEPIMSGYMMSGRSGSLTRQFMFNIGMTDEQHLALTNMNDREQASFAQIADWIEENL